MITDTKSREYELGVTRVATHISDTELQVLQHTLENPKADRSASACGQRLTSGGGGHRSAKQWRIGGQSGSSGNMLGQGYL